MSSQKAFLGGRPLKEGKNRGESRLSHGRVRLTCPGGLEKMGGRVGSGGEGKEKVKSY